MDMRFNWLLDLQRQKQFHFHWKKGFRNKADYVTKHHPSKLVINSWRILNCIRKIICGPEQALVMDYDGRIKVKLTVIGILFLTDSGGGGVSIRQLSRGSVKEMM